LVPKNTHQNQTWVVASVAQKLCHQWRKKNSMIPIASSAEFSTKPKTLTQEILIQIPGCKVYLMDEGDVHELTQGTFMIIKIVHDNVSLATIIKIGNNVQFHKSICPRLETSLFVF
jgi:hypothetical protein